MERIERNGVRVLTPSDESYPELLREVYDRPAILYVKGDFKPVDVQTLAIVGTRRPTMYGKELTMRITPTLVQQGLTIVSGLAVGVDTIAHRSALDAGPHNRCPG